MLKSKNSSSVDLSSAKKIATGEWGETYLENGRVYKVFYEKYSSNEKLEQITNGALLQNKIQYSAKVFSVTLRKDNRIWVEMEYLKGYRPLHEVTTSKTKIKVIEEELASNNIAHNGLNTSNILVGLLGNLKIIGFDEATQQEGGSEKDSLVFKRIANMYATV